MNDPEMINAYSGFVFVIAFSILIVLSPIAVIVANYYDGKGDLAEYVRELAERIRRLDDRQDKIEELFESVEKQTDHQFDALLSLLKDVKTLQEKVELKNEDDNANV